MSQETAHSTLSASATLLGALAEPLRQQAIEKHTLHMAPTQPSPDFLCPFIQSPLFLASPFREARCVSFRAVPLAFGSASRALNARTLLGVR